jgi:digeranylgeranylglycerophospholipid reductase
VQDMEALSDVAVIGGGPCGSFMALNLARHGIKVTVFEEHGEIGVPSHCAGHLSISGLKRVGLYPLPAKVVENTFRGAVFHSPRGNELRVCFSSPVTCVVSRVLLDKHIAEMAKEAGTRYSLGSRVESLIIGDGYVKGISAKQGEATKSFSAKIVADAEGISSGLLRQAGLSSLDRSRLVNGVEAEVEGVRNVESDMVEVFLGRGFAPGFFAWLMPLGDGKAKVGLAAKTGNPRQLLRDFMLKHSKASGKLRNARILRTAFHPITLGGQIPKTYSDGFLAVGDVASHVKPTTGGGLVWGLGCSRIAAEVIVESLGKGDFSSVFLSAYQKRCDRFMGFDTRVMVQMRKMLDALSDKQVDEALRFCATIGLNKSLEGVNDIDFQGRSILRALGSPRMLTALLYFFYLYLL